MEFLEKNNTTDTDLSVLYFDQELDVNLNEKVTFGLGNKCRFKVNYRNN